MAQDNTKNHVTVGANNTVLYVTITVRCVERRGVGGVITAPVCMLAILYWCSGAEMAQDLFLPRDA